MPIEHYVGLRIGADQTVGAGVFLTSKYLLTAHHCVKSVTEDALVDVELTDGHVVPAEVVETIPDQDLALLRLTTPSDVFVQLIRPSDGQPNDRWDSPFTPRDTQTSLHGHVVRVDVEYTSTEGVRFRALQLNVVETLGSYVGYSGSSVICVRGDGTKHMIGMLTRQGMDRLDPKRASNVLFAAMIVPAIVSLKSGHAEKVLESFVRGETAPAAGADPEVEASAKHPGFRSHTVARQRTTEDLLALAATMAAQGIPVEVDVETRSEVENRSETKTDLGSVTDTKTDVKTEIQLVRLRFSTGLK